MAETTDSEAYATLVENLSELRDYVGRELGLSEWMVITQEQINNFAEATKDHQWIHVNPEMAALHSPYKKTITHGFLILSLVSKFIYDAHKVKNLAMGVNYGLDKVRFPNAVPVDARVRGRIVLLSFDEIPGGARYKLRITVEIEGEEKPACVAEKIVQVYSIPS